MPSELPSKPTVELTDYNWSDYLPDDYPMKLVEELKAKDPAIVMVGIDPDDKIVTRLLAWIGLQSGLSRDVRFAMSRHDAVVLLEQLAGCPW